ncbi:hypothetical protein JTE90_011759 [Oedothorax gibbosus]|uniref:Uncharacterized protein n=1 Tax=Oedothorax gibbosus TaxID=931172 RepID=A0AAV6VU47_9ARAC|nr:hypothetical protein JTE90_011759 [Oedothorax gibbosus]
MIKIADPPLIFTERNSNDNKFGASPSGVFPNSFIILLTKEQQTRKAERGVRAEADVKKKEPSNPDPTDLPLFRSPSGRTQRGVEMLMHPELVDYGMSFTSNDYSIFVLNSGRIWGCHNMYF